MVTAATLQVPTQYATIQAAIDAAQPGDEVRMAAGTYTGSGNRNLDFLGKDITVAGEGAATTIIDVEGQGLAFWIHRHETSAARIEGLTVRHGNTYFHNLQAGGGISCPWSSPTIQDCIIENCVGTEGGGGIAMWVDTPATISGCIIRNNESWGESDGSGDGAGLELDGPVTVVNCTIEGNRGGGGAFRGGYGGGLLCRGGVVLQNCRIADNEIAGSGSHAGLGGGIYGEDVTLSGCQIVGNQVGGDGGGLYLAGAASIQDCVISGNRAGFGGGGIAVLSPSLVSVVGCTIVSNYADGQGEAGQHSGGGIACRQSSRVEIQRSILWNNCSVVGDNEAFVGAGCTLAFICSDLDRSGIVSEGTVEVSGDCLNHDPHFCTPPACEDAPAVAGEYTLSSDSICLPGNNTCGTQMGALGARCGPTSVESTTWGSIKFRFR